MRIAIILPLLLIPFLTNGFIYGQEFATEATSSYPLQRLLGKQELLALLELTEDQELRVLDMRNTVEENEKKRLNSKLSFGQRGADYTKSDALHLELTEDFENFLLPHQVLRIRQISFQQSILNGIRFDFGFLKLQAELRLSEVQVETIKSKSEKTRELVDAEIDQFVSRIKKIRIRAQEEMASELTDDQKEKYEGLIGQRHDNNS